VTRLMEAGTEGCGDGDNCGPAAGRGVKRGAVVHAGLI